MHTPSLFQVNMGNTARNRWTRFGVRMPRTLDHKLKSALTSTVWSQCTSVPNRRTNGWTSWK